MARGTTDKRWFNPDEPKHDPIDAACPVELTDPRARAEWDRIVGDLVSRSHVTKVDRATLILYCLKYAQWLKLEELARTHPDIFKSPNGYPVPNPAIGMANKASQIMLRAAAELGITPSSRSRVSSGGPVDEGDDFAKHQRARPSFSIVKP